MISILVLSLPANPWDLSLFVRADNSISVENRPFRSSSFTYSTCCWVVVIKVDCRPGVVDATRQLHAIRSANTHYNRLVAWPPSQMCIHTMSRRTRLVEGTQKFTLPFVMAFPRRTRRTETLVANAVIALVLETNRSRVVFLNFAPPWKRHLVSSVPAVPNKGDLSKRQAL